MRLTLRESQFRPFRVDYPANLFPIPKSIDRNYPMFIDDVVHKSVHKVSIELTLTLVFHEHFVRLLHDADGFIVIYDIEVS